MAGKWFLCWLRVINFFLNKREMAGKDRLLPENFAYKVRYRVFLIRRGFCRIKEYFLVRVFRINEDLKIVCWGIGEVKKKAFLSWEIDERKRKKEALWVGDGRVKAELRYNKVFEFIEQNRLIKRISNFCLWSRKFRAKNWQNFLF